ncbi:unnamed protein product [Acanthoscelides obtectus]|uniref:Uncharacterized protein n=1 Tax=Acanthoscelides obtectus TaxID=200917 RepID=A0A9P0LMY7_ACAOB|nr:unnamed protein product [Acanthoscelides obtectus]CAK1632877.1 hypothetical protein AOBTE_LOCUS7785 [Acanthoscelides obtectus]
MCPFTTFCPFFTLIFGKSTRTKSTFSIAFTLPSSEDESSNLRLPLHSELELEGEGIYPHLHIDTINITHR